jgi:hypothetical protein
VDGAFQMIKDLKTLLRDPEQFATTASGKDGTLHDSVRVLKTTRLGAAC